MPSGLSIYTAYPLLALGYKIRREIWADAGISGQVLPPGALPLRWIRLHRDAGWQDGCAWIQSTTFNRVVTAADFTAEDASAHDWTTEGINTQNNPDNWTDPNGPNDPIIDPPPGSGGGSSGSGGGSGSGSGGSGGGGTGGGGTTPPGPRPPRPLRLGASIVVNLTRTSDACVAPLISGVHPAVTSNSWFGTVTIIDPAARPFEIWSITVLNCKTREVIYHGTTQAGVARGFGPSLASGQLGSRFAFSATAFLFGAGGSVTAQGSATATFPPGCTPEESAYGPDPDQYYAPDGDHYYAPPP